MSTNLLASKETTVDNVELVSSLLKKAWESEEVI